MSEKPVVPRQLESILPGLLAVAYLVFLIVPWALTYEIARHPDFLFEKGERDYFFFDGPYNRGYHITLAYSTLRAIRILNAIQVILCFPVLSALLARATVVYSQRRKPEQKHSLTVRQLFALADHGWYNVLLVLQRPAISALLIFGWLLLVVAFVLPLARTALVTYDALSLELDPQTYFIDAQIMGTSPAPSGLAHVDTGSVVDTTRSKLQLTTGGYESQLWPICNDANTTGYWDTSCGLSYNPYTVNQSSLWRFWEFNPVNNYSTTTRNYSTDGSALMFASSIQAGSTTGYAPNGYALALQSGAKCMAASPEDVSSNCTQASQSPQGWSTSMFIPEELRIDICLPSPSYGNYGSFWGSVESSSPWTPYKPVEHVYIGIQEQTNEDGDIFDSWGYSGTLDDILYGGELGTQTTLWVHCQLDTALSYFLLGNDSTNGIPSLLLEELPSDFSIPTGNTEAGTSEGIGPLMATAQALFGSGTWFDTINSLVNNTIDNTTEYALVQLLCQSIPLQQASYFTQSTTIDTYCDTEFLLNRLMLGSPNANLADLVRRFFYTFDIPRIGRAALNTGAFFANDKLLSAALPYQISSSTSDYFNTITHFARYNTESSMPIVTTTAFVVVTVLIVIQVLAICALLIYIYSTRVWTHTLDALALAGLGAQLAERDVFHYPEGSTWADSSSGPLRPSEVDATAREKLFHMDGLIDVTGHSMLRNRDHQQPQQQVELGNLPPPYVASQQREGQGVVRMSTDSAPPYEHTSGEAMWSDSEARVAEEARREGAR